MPKHSEQQEFKAKGFAKPKDSFGGSLIKSGNPRTRRPLASKYAIHMCLRGVQGGLRNPKHFAEINRLVYATAAKYGIKVYEYANVGNHLHALIRLGRIGRWTPFIRELTSRIAATLGIKTFWKNRPFTRIVRGWKKAYRIAKEYVRLNVLEADGFINRRDTRTLKDLRAIFEDG